MRVRFPREAVDLVSFGRSPVWEMLRSLRVLVDLKNHPLHITWALRARERLTPGLADEIERYSFWFSETLLTFPDLWPVHMMWTWPQARDVLLEAPIERFAEPLIHAALLRNRVGDRYPLSRFREDTELQHRAMTQVQQRSPVSVPVLRELIDEPMRCRESFVEFLSAYWDACLAVDWPVMRERLDGDIARRGREASARGLPFMLARLSHHVHHDPHTDEVIVLRPGEHLDREPITLDLGLEDQILLVPSHFAWPELTVQALRDPGRLRFVMTYAVADVQRQGTPPIPPNDLLKLLRAAGDPTRLQILQLLARRPRPIREIAGLLRLTEAAISKHAKILHNAGWVTTERRSYYVYYKLAQESISLVSRELERMLE